MIAVADAATIEIIYCYRFAVIRQHKQRKMNENSPFTNNSVRARDRGIS